jgi:hypothetical protein
MLYQAGAEAGPTRITPVAGIMRVFVGSGSVPTGLEGHISETEISSKDTNLSAYAPLGCIPTKSGEK